MTPYILTYLLISLVENFRIKKNLICAIIIFLFMGFRYNVGWDYRFYFEFGTKYYLQEKSLFLRGKELANLDPNIFQYLRIEFLNKIIYKLTWYFGNPQLVFILYSFLLVFFIKKGLDNQKKFTVYPWLFFLGFPIFFFSFTSLMRQSVAVAIVFYSYKYIKNKEILKFILLVLLASLFHKSAIFSIVLYIVPKLKIKYKYIVLFMSTAFFSITILKKILKLSIFSNYSIYVNDAVGEGGKIIYFLIIILIVIYLLIYKKISEEKYHLINIVLLGAYLYVALIDLGHLGPRMSQYFLIYTLYTIDDVIILFRPQKIVRVIFICVNLTFIMLILYGDFIQERRQFIPYQINFFNRGVEWEES